MSTPHDRHIALRDFVLDRADTTGLEALIAPPPAAPDAAGRLGIHRNCTQIGLADALADAFPVLRRLVGDAFFSALARAYVRAHPPRAASLLFYGADMAGFVAAFAPSAHMPWLADIARLEHLWAQSYHAADAPTLVAGDLFALAEDMLARLVLVPHPSLRLMHSPWPVGSIWLANQPDSADATVDLALGPERPALVRPHDQVRLLLLSPGADSLVRACADGRALDQAWTAALVRQPDFDLAGELAVLLHHGVFQGYHLP